MLRYQEVSSGFSNSKHSSIQEMIFPQTGWFKNIFKDVGRLEKEADLHLRSGAEMLQTEVSFPALMGTIDIQIMSIVRIC